MKNASNSLGNGLKGYAERAMDAVLSSFAAGVGRVVYNSAKSLTPSLKNGMISNLVDVYERDLRNELIRGRSKAWKGAMKRVKNGEIAPDEFDDIVGTEFISLENSYLKNLKNIQPTIEPAKKEFLEYKDSNKTIPFQNQGTGYNIEAQLASAFLGNAGSIMMVNPTREGEVGYGRKALSEIGKAVGNGILHLSNLIYRPLYKHRKGAAIVVGAAALGAAADLGFNHGDNVKKVVKFVKDPVKGISSAAAFFGFFENPIPPATGNPAANASVVTTPQVSETPQPNYDYYDKELKVGVDIKGPQSFKDNVTEMLKIIKKKAPDRYAAVAPYFPKNGIVRFDRNFNYYATTDEIGLSIITDIRGGSDNENLRLDAAIGLLEELDNARNFKTGVIYKDNNEAELAVNKRIANDHVEFGLWNQTQADAYIKEISEELKSGEYHKKYI